MSYRATRKAKKLWSERANAKRDRLRMEGEPIADAIPEDDHITITVTRKLTGGVA